MRDVSRRPFWELSCEISRARESGPEDRRGHRFFVDDELAARLRLDRWPDSERRERMCRAVKRMLLRDMEELFSDPTGGLDSRRPLSEADLAGS